MQVEIVETEALSRVVKFRVPKNSVSKMYDEFFNDIRKDAEVPGFRKGSATNQALQIKYGDLSRAEVSGRLIYKAVQDFMENDKTVRVAGNPVVTDEFRATDKKKFVGSFNLDGTFSCDVVVEIEPTVDVKNYTGVEISEPPFNTEEWVSNKIEEFQIIFADRQPVQDRAVQMGDEVVIDYETEGQPAVQAQTLTVGRSGIGDEFDQALVGRPIKEEFSFTTNGGSTKCFIHSACAVNLHPVDEELATLAAYDSLDAMRADIAARGEKEIGGPLKFKIYHEIMTQVVKSNEFPVPLCWVDAEMALIVKRLGLKEMPKEENVLTELRRAAKEAVQQNFLLDRIYEKEKSIHITGEELLADFTTQGAKVGKNAEEVLAYLKESQQYEGYVSMLEKQRAIDFVIKSARVKTKE